MKSRVLMIGAGRDVRGGVSSVVNGYYEAALDEACELTYLPTMEDGSQWKKLWVAVRARIRFEGLLPKHDILHVHMSSDKSFFRKALFIRRAKRAGKKIIIHLHGSTFDLFYKERCSDRQRTQVRRIFAMADRVIALSEDWKRFLVESICAAEKIEVMYNGVIMPDAFQRDYENKNILFLGRLGERKGIYDLLAVLPELLKKYPDAQVYLGGDGEVKAVEEICRRDAMTSQVHLLGWVRGAEKEELLKKCSIYTLPSYHEGMPMSVLEAMSYGMAVASTYVGGIPHVIEDGENGMLCSPGSTEELCRALDGLLRDAALRRRLGEKAAQTIRERFDVGQNVKRLLALYESLLAIQ